MLLCPFEKIFPSQLKKDDLFFMQLAYNEAIEAWKKDEVPIGVVIVKDGNVIASAHNLVESTKDPSAHAEVLAISQAANTLGDWRLNGCSLYVTKEPCPMCAGASIMARISTVIYAVEDPKMGCLGGAYASHRIPTLNHRLEAKRGPYGEECKRLLQAFFSLKRSTDRPQELLG